METDRCRDNKLKCAVLDTNVLMYVYLRKVDVISQLRELGFSRIIVPECVLDELKKLEVSLTGKERIAARFAIKLAEKLEIVESEKGCDQALIEVAKANNCCLITNDKMLRKRARNEGIAVGMIREMNRVEVMDI